MPQNRSAVKRNRVALADRKKIHVSIRLPDIEARRKFHEFVWLAKVKGRTVGSLFVEAIDLYMQHQKNGEIFETQVLDTLARLEKRLDELAWQIQNLQAVAVAPTTKPQLERASTPTRVDVRRFASVRSEANNPWLQILEEKSKRG
mgnify:CR=1 FL=1